MVLAGVSNRKVCKLAEEAFGARVSASTVSNLMKDLEPALEAFRKRPLETFRYLLVDARFDKVREGDSVSSRAFLWATGVNDQGEREVLGWLDWRGETKVSWETLFNDLIGRGLKGVQLVVSDAHAGPVKAAGAAFSGAAWQECQAHFLRRAVEQVKTAVPEGLSRPSRHWFAPPVPQRSSDPLLMLRDPWVGIRFPRVGSGPPSRSFRPPFHPLGIPFRFERAHDLALDSQGCSRDAEETV